MKWAVIFYKLDIRICLSMSKYQRILSNISISNPELRYRHIWLPVELIKRDYKEPTNYIVLD